MVKNLFIKDGILSCNNYRGGFFVNFKEIEKLVPQYVRDYIRDNCYVRTLVGYETVKREKTQTGVKVTSRSKYETIFNQDKYKELVRATYIQDYQEDYIKQQNIKAKKQVKESGKNVTIKEFFQDLFRDHFEFRRGQKDNKGRRIYLKSFLFNIDAAEKVIDEKRVIRNIDSLYKKVNRYGYFTPNMFISHQFFTKEMLSLMGVIVLDFDLDKVHKVLTKEQLKKYIKLKIGVFPNYIWDTKTKGNFQVAILIEKMPATPSSVHLYEQIVKEMIVKLGDVVDESCYNANHIFSRPMNNARMDKFVRKYNDEIYNINKFRWLLDERDKRREKERTIIDFKEEIFMREPSIQALFDGNVSWRDHACFTLALVMRWLGKDEFETENFILGDWINKVNNDNYDHRFTIKEAQKCVKHAYSGNYKCFHSKWVGIVTGIECNFKGYFRWTKYENKGIYKMNTKQCLVEFLRKNNGEWQGTKQELANEVGANEETVKKIIAKMKKDDELRYETKRGRGVKTIFTLVGQAEFDRELVVSYDGIDSDLDAIEELEHVMESLHA